tara:strand:+ start:2845 stop:3309 length:465 start_codon:yes stop_codon:yes gene_type:complete
MALSNKKYTRIYSTTGTDDDKIDSTKESKFRAKFESNEYLQDKVQEDLLAPLMFQIQQMQDELDYLRTEILNNKNKTGITSSQASAITANTAKTSFPGLGTTSTTALAGDTKIISLGSSTTYAFSNLINNRGIFTIRLTATSSGVTKSVDLRLV